MKINDHVDEHLLVDVRGAQYPVTVAGKGIPCLTIGIGTLMQRTLSANFMNHCKVYSSDLYWDQKNSLGKNSSLTLGHMIEDIAELAQNLRIQNYIIIAHSAFGIIAAEFAKKYPGYASGLIMVGTPVNSNSEVAEHNNHIFQHYADERRKSIDLKRRETAAKADLSSLNMNEKFLYEYIYRDAPRYWYDPEFDCTDLWKGIMLDGVISQLFSEILPSIDVRENLETIEEPIFLAAGLSDYDCCPVQLWSALPNRPKNMTLSIFEKSGHYPHYEEQELFDERVIKWANQWKLIDRAESPH